MEEPTRNCFTCYYEPKWKNNTGVCKWFSKVGWPLENAPRMRKHTNPNEIRYDEWRGLPINACEMWKRK